MNKKSCILVVIVSLFPFFWNCLRRWAKHEGKSLGDHDDYGDAGDAHAVPPQIHTQCITKENILPKKEEPDQECKMIKQDIKGATVK